MSDEYLPPAPPAGLKDAGRALWVEVVRDAIFESHELKILAEAAKTLDLIHTLQDPLDADGVMVDTMHGQKVHPAAGELRQQRVVLARLLAAARIPVDDGPKAGAPRGVYSMFGAGRGQAPAAARARQDPRRDSRYPAVGLRVHRRRRFRPRCGQLRGAGRSLCGMGSSG
jgi:hypothetical protein